MSTPRLGYEGEQAGTKPSGKHGREDDRAGKASTVDLQWTHSQPPGVVTIYIHQFTAYVIFDEVKGGPP
ncbi:hypothetical protein PG996_004819 [Apiospora saccharicola]|uniref:Uncharacterized protein n=1 Tax=Apiospora saccharicola TaxID=335842 RepID=A0ABR1W8Z0_9PEZI